MLKDTKCALVTGASSGIGQGIAIKLAAEGYDIALTYAPEYDEKMSNSGSVKVTRKEIEECGQRCFIYEADFSDDKVACEIVEKAYHDMGRLDVVVANAGKDGRHSILTATAKDLNHFFDINLKSVLLLCGAAARFMVKDEIAGNIIFVTSSRAERAYAEDFIYGATKAALKRASESIALDLSPYGFRVNCVAPGATKTHFDPAHEVLKNGIPLKRLAMPKDIAEVVAFLVSDRAEFITGIQMRVDGGLILSGLPEGWTEAKCINPQWVSMQYQQMMNTYFSEEKKERGL